MVPATPTRVVFVDDDPLVLRSITRLARRTLRDFDIDCSEDPVALLEQLRERPADIVVADLNMGRMDGVTFLARVRAEHPSCARIVLSGATQTRVLGPTTEVAHQFLSKPIHAGELAETLEGVRDVRALVKDERLRGLVAGDNGLPSPPATYLALQRLLQNQDVRFGEVAELIRGDVALSARILQVASSAYVGARMPAGDLMQAIVRIGFDLLATLVLSHGLAGMFSGSVPGFSPEAHNRHGLRVAALARAIADNGADQAFTAGLLHGVGRLILATRAPAEMSAALAADNPRQAVVDRLGVGFAELGAFLLGLWGLPVGIVNAVARHDRPSLLSGTGAGAAQAVYFAERLAADPDAPILDDDGDHQPGICRKLADAHSADLPGWRDLARRLR
jgi:HD-like signal output (HDOD) protein/ActR/RegA family two-component response regulator